MTGRRLWCRRPRHPGCSQPGSGRLRALVASDQGSQGLERATDGQNYVELRGGVTMTPDVGLAGAGCGLPAFPAPVRLAGAARTAAAQPGQACPESVLLTLGEMI